MANKQNAKAGFAAALGSASSWVNEPDEENTCGLCGETEERCQCESLQPDGLLRYRYRELAKGEMDRALKAMEREDFLNAEIYAYQSAQWMTKARLHIERTPNDQAQRPGPQDAET